jgi:hypothetical protein
VEGRPELRGRIAAVAAAACLLIATPASAQDASAGPSAAPSEAQPITGLPDTIGEPPLELEPGLYRDRSLGPSLVFEVGPGWTALPSIPEVGAAFIRDEPGGFFAISEFHGEVFTDPCRTPANEATFGPEAGTVDLTAEAFIEYIASHPLLTASVPVASEIAGLPAWSVEVTAAVPDDCDPPQAWLWNLPEVGEYFLRDGQRSRIVAIQVGDEVIVTSAEILPDGDFESLVALTDAILASLEVEGSE